VARWDARRDRERSASSYRRYAARRDRADRTLPIPRQRFHQPTAVKQFKPAEN